MILRYFLISSSLISVVPALAAPALSTLDTTQKTETGAIEGKWTGKLLQRDWTFEFDNENGNWSGKYMRSDGSRWLPLNDLVIAGNAVSFSIESKPKMSFSLEIDGAKPSMSGKATIDGVAAVPFAAMRNP